MATDAPDSQLMNTLVRMVVPLKREFGRSLNVGQFLHDVTYASEVLDVALRSRDPRLLEYARYVEQRLHGARVADLAPSASAVPARPAAVPTPAVTAAPAPAAAASEDELRARVLKKYTSGLR